MNRLVGLLQRQIPWRITPMPGRLQRVVMSTNPKLSSLWEIPDSQNLVYNHSDDTFEAIPKDYRERCSPWKHNVGFKTTPIVKADSQETAKDGVASDILPTSVLSDSIAQEYVQDMMEFDREIPIYDKIAEELRKKHGSKDIASENGAHLKSIIRSPLRRSGGPVMAGDILHNN